MQRNLTDASALLRVGQFYDFRNRSAVIRYSGFWSDANYKQHLEKLQVALRAANLVSVGEAAYARYNAPFTPWFMRRNEIWLHLTKSL